MSPRRPKTPCLYPGCPVLIEASTGGYCEKHKSVKRKQSDARRGTFRERGYTTAFDKVKAIKKRQDPLCESCLKTGRVVPVEIVHHVIPVEDGGPMLDVSNLMSVCRTCHGKLHSQGLGGGLNPHGNGSWCRAPLFCEKKSPNKI